MPHETWGPPWGRAATIEDAIGLVHHARPGRRPSRALAAYTADRLPRTTAIVRKAARTGRLALLAAPPAVAQRNALIAAVSRFGPGLVLRGFDGIADRRPPSAADRARVS